MWFKLIRNPSDLAPADDLALVAASRCLLLPLGHWNTAGMKNFPSLLLLVFSLFLLACATVTKTDIANADYGHAPSVIEDSILQWAEYNLIDPESVRITRVTPARRGYFSNIHGVVYGYICTAFINAKNRFGGYTGAKKYYFIIHDDIVVHSLEDGGAAGMFFKYVD